MALRVRNWDRHQHFTRRRPTWIKLHHRLLDDGVYADLPVESRALLPMIWLFASEFEGGVIDRSNRDTAKRIGWPLEAYLRALIPLSDALFVFLDGENADDPLIFTVQPFENKEKSEVTPKNSPVRLNKPSESQRVRDTEKSLSNGDTESLMRADKENSTGLFDGEEDASRGDATARAIEFWNDMAGQVGLSKAMRVTGPRRAKMLARLRDVRGLDGWKAVLAKIAASDFLSGRKPGSDFQATFDWILKPANLQKTMEGNYDNKNRSRETSRSARQPSQRERAIAGLDDFIARRTESQPEGNAHMEAPGYPSEPEGTSRDDDDY